MVVKMSNNSINISFGGYVTCTRDCASAGHPTGEPGSIMKLTCKGSIGKEQCSAVVYAIVEQNRELKPTSIIAPTRNYKKEVFLT